jgi:TonB family protein
MLTVRKIWVRQAVMAAGLALVWACPWAQTKPAASATASAPKTSGPVEVDESKLPDWVKKQANNPMKWIILNDAKAVKPKPSASAAKPTRTSPTDTKIDPVTTAKPSSAPARPGASDPKPAETAGGKPINAQPTTTTTNAAQPSPTTATAPAVADKPATAKRPPAESELIPVKQTAPVIPPSLIDSISAGRVVVTFTVNADGTVSDATVTESTDRQINRYVTAAVNQWVFKPIGQTISKTAVFVLKPDN